jgi:hypothetical protein
LCQPLVRARTMPAMRRCCALTRLLQRRLGPAPPSLRRGRGGSTRGAARTGRRRGRAPAAAPAAGAAAAAAASPAAAAAAAPRAPEAAAVAADAAAQAAEARAAPLRRPGARHWQRRDRQVAGERQRGESSPAGAQSTPQRGSEQRARAGRAAGRLRRRSGALQAEWVEPVVQLRLLQRQQAQVQAEPSQRETGPLLLLPFLLLQRA